MLDREIALQRRDDGLYHSYNLLELDDERAVVHPLDVMLEGQVAALSSGAVGAAEAQRLAAALFDGPLYRDDQQSFLLYPERELPSFLEKNTVPEESVRAVPLLQELLRAGDESLVARDAEGNVRFQADFANDGDLAAALARLERQQRWRELARADRSSVLRVFEEVFKHQSFTGRSGTMYGYEGLGCIYWHMVAKLLLAVQEIAWRAHRDGDPKPLRDALADVYYRIRAGLGFEKTPAEYGAFPTDPYSHTPRHAGARQPGMTGQVKEEILTRLGELGVCVRDGGMQFRPILLHRREFLREGRAFRFEDVHDGAGSLEVPGNALAFTFCQVPVVYELSDESRIRVTRRDGSTFEVTGDTLAPQVAGPLFDRCGEFVRIDVRIPENRLLP
jgi:hypothetical protein